MCPHPPKRGLPFWDRPRVHTGFYRAWTANSLHTEVMGYLQVTVLITSADPPVWQVNGAARAPGPYLQLSKLLHRVYSLKQATSALTHPSLGAGSGRRADLHGPISIKQTNSRIAHQHRSSRAAKG